MIITPSKFKDMFFKDFIKNPQTTIALTFMTHIISGIDGVFCSSFKVYCMQVLMKKLKWPRLKTFRTYISYSKKNVISMRF